MNLLKEKLPKTACSTTSQFFCSMIFVLTVLNTSEMSMPLPSFGSGSSPPMVISNIWRRSSRSVMFNIVSSSLILSTYPLDADLLTSSTGTRSTGAYRGFWLRGFSYHRSRPSARYSVLAPFSSIEVFAVLYRCVRDVLNGSSSR